MHICLSGFGNKGQKEKKKGGVGSAELQYDSAGSVVCPLNELHPSQAEMGVRSLSFS